MWQYPPPQGGPDPLADRPAARERGGATYCSTLPHCISPRSPELPLLQLAQYVGGAALLGGQVGTTYTQHTLGSARWERGGDIVTWPRPLGRGSCAGSPGGIRVDANNWLARVRKAPRPAEEGPVPACSEHCIAPPHGFLAVAFPVQQSHRHAASCREEALNVPHGSRVRRVPLLQSLEVRATR